MSFESDVSYAAFDAFAIAATVNGSSTLNSLPVTVIIDRNVEVQDELGEVRYVGAMVSGKKPVFTGWSTGDLVDCDEGKFKLQELVRDDGYILEIAATPSPTA